MTQLRGPAQSYRNLEAEVERLRELVKKAVTLGLSLEDAYEYNAKRFHNVNDWEAEEHDRVQTARNALCDVLDDLVTPRATKGTK